MALLPSGTVTFLFSDVEGSTQLLERHGQLMGTALARHYELFEEVVERHKGAIFETVGDAVYAAFGRADDAVAAALEAHRALAAESWGPVGRIAVRIALHSGAVERRGDHYFGAALFRCARLQVLGYGEQTLLSGVTAGLAAGALPEGAGLRDLGRHRLKDLGEPEQVFQLLHPDLRADFPALRSLDAHPHNLPTQLSSFVGRDVELATLTDMLDTHRLVTLTGPGGIGKTRLALQAAAERLERHADGAFFVDLAALREPSLVAASIATTLGLHEEPGTPITSTLHEYLGARRVLLLLDNLEQLLPAAAPIVASLLASVPQLHIVVTSRAPVRIRGEQEYPVPALASGSPQQLDDTLPPAVALFIERARDVQPGLTVDDTTGPLIAEISARLDGLPLAIELAAARLRLFGLPALRERLARRLPLLTAGSRDLPERQQTLRATIAWSEELLTPTQQRLFARLSVFVGGFSLEAVERVCLFDIEGGDLDDLGALVEHSLVRSLDDPLGGPRYTMLETIHEYALERLQAGTEAAAIRDRLSEHLLDVMEQAEPRLRTDEQTVTLRQLDLELDDLRATLIWLRERGDGQRLGRLAAGVAWYCTQRGLLSEGRRWIAEARGLAPNTDALLTAKLLFADGTLALELGELAEAATLLRQSADLYRTRGDYGQLARVLDGLANAEQSRGELDVATEAGIEARQLARAQGDTRTEASAVGNLAMVAARAGRLEEAEAGFGEAVELFKKTFDRRAVVIGLGNLGEVARKRGRMEAAGRGIRDALDAARELGDTDLEGWILANLAGWHLEEGDLDSAAAELAAGLSKLASAETALDAASAVDTAALILARRSQFADAAMAWGASDAAFARMGAPREADSTAEAEVAAARDLLGKSEFERLREAGAAMPFSVVIEVVVSRLSDQETTEAGEDSTVSRPASD